MTTNSNDHEHHDKGIRLNQDSSVTQQPASTQVVSELEEVDMVKRHAKHHKKWNRRLKVLFCCLGYKKNKDSIADVASLLAEYFSDLEIPSSDIAAGFVLLSKYQEAQRQHIVKNQQYGIEQYLSSVPITEQTKFIDITTAEDSHLINDLVYYMNYSLAIFGWPMQMVDDPCALFCICPYLKFSPCCNKKRNRVKPEKQSKKGEKSHKTKEGKNDKVSQETNHDNHLSENNEQIKTNDNASLNISQNTSEPGRLNRDCDQPIILGDNCCSCNLASFERRLAAHNYEIIYITYRVNVNMVPFLVAADHSKQTIVVALRGSMSLSDMITDMNGNIDKLPIDNCPEDWTGHRGITRAALYVKNSLIQEHILDAAFNCRPDLGSRNYRLTLCGHSLGAGAAAILGIMLLPHYPTLRAYLYSPPGGVLSLSAVEHTKKFATSILLGNDCVPRLGIAQLERLRYHTLLSLKSSEKSAGAILSRALLPKFCTKGNEVEYDPDLSLNLLHGTEAKPFDYNGSKVHFQLTSQVLYVPGRLIHIVKDHSFQSRAKRLFKEPIYQAIWTENTNYDRIVIGEGMFYDHLPNHLMHAMKMLFSKTLPARKDPKSAPTVNHDTIETVEADTVDENKFDDLKQVSEKSVTEKESVTAMQIGDDNNNQEENVELDENNNSTDNDSKTLAYPNLNDASIDAK